MSVLVELLVTPACPHARDAEARVREVAARLAPEAEIRRILVGDATDATRLAFPGSPTVRIDDEDLEGAHPGPPTLSCRSYDGSGAPPEWLLEARLLRALRPRSLLFLCVANSARSQLAEAIARSLAPEGVRVQSAGSAASRVHPYALRVLAELGLDASGQRSKGVDEITGDVEAVITLCAEEVCPAWLGRARRLHWALPDPVAGARTAEEAVEGFRRTRDELRRRLEPLLAPTRTAL
ncbi:MAG: arsenate reductase ArsC [Gemmatimonadota bacterium]